jgi:Zn-dependent protease with chaperone function
MNTDIIPYDPYHPHLGYTLVIACLAWLSVGLYSRFALAQHPKQRIVLYTLVIGLPIYAEAASYLIYRVRPAPNTPVGYLLSHFHAYVIQRIPIDTFLSPFTEEMALALLFTLMVVSLARFSYGHARLKRSLIGALPLIATCHAPLAARLATANNGRQIPPIMVFHHSAPLAFTIGLLAPCIYLSSGLVEILAPNEVLAVLCHEWAHILRRDNLWNWMVRLLRDLLCFLPGSHLLWRAIVASQDLACDALAVEITHEPLVLARALVKVAAAWPGCETAFLLPVGSPFALKGGGTRSRIEQMLQLNAAVSSPQERAVGAYVLATLLLLLSVLPALLGS